MNIRAQGPADRSWAAAVAADYFGSPQVVSRGILHDTRQLSGIIAEDDSGRIGLLRYRTDGDECEAVTTISPKGRVGMGTAMLQSGERMAAHAVCCRLCLVTTNTNQRAMKFYRSAGWVRAAIHKSAVMEARKM